jgi:hypothetical protein
MEGYSTDSLTREVIQTVKVFQDELHENRPVESYRDEKNVALIEK